MYNLYTKKNISFPPGFLWGSGVAGHQVEGNNVNSHHFFLEQKNKPEDRSGLAIDHYNRYRDDISLVKKLGHKAFRTSVEWSRIEPREGVIDREAIKHYVDEFALLKKLGLKTFVTLHHFSHPQWFEEKGGWSKELNLKYFERYLKIVLPVMAPYADFWHTSNEFNGFGINLKINMLKAHALAYRLIKKYSKAPVSYAHAFALQKPYNPCDKKDIKAAENKDMLLNEGFIRAIRTGWVEFPGRKKEFIPGLKDSVDYWSINHYTRHLLQVKGSKVIERRYDHKRLKMSDMDFYMEEFYPEGIIECCLRMKDKPIYITENGISCNDDKFRIAYIALTLNALQEAIEMGADVRGYLHWSTFDNYEWNSYKPRFGLVDVNRKTMKRTPKPSAFFYKDIIKKNGFNGQLVRKYLKHPPCLV